MPATPTPNGLSKHCQYQGHTLCQGQYIRNRPGILPGIRYAHHPKPNPGEALHQERARCLCQCHQPRQLPPSTGTTTPPETTPPHTTD